MGEAGACTAKEMKLVLNNGQIAAWRASSPTNQFPEGFTRDCCANFQKKKKLYSLCYFSFDLNLDYFLPCLLFHTFILYFDIKNVGCVFALNVTFEFN